MRVHKSYIVAKNKILAYSSQDIEMKNIEIPVGRVFREAFLEEMYSQGVGVRFFEVFGKSYCRVSMGTMDEMKLSSYSCSYKVPKFSLARVRRP